MKDARALLAAIIFALISGCNAGSTETGAAVAPVDASAPVYDTMENRIRVATVVDGLAYPYCFVFLPDGSILLTEMGGRLRLIRNGKLLPDPIAGTPEVYSDAPSHGLMDIALHPKFAENHLVYLSYNKSGEKGVTGSSSSRGI